MFDPYHKWLGIRKDQRPPTHYQLLGIAEDEQDADVIEEAAIRQTTHVRSYQLGPHAADCTRILKEIAKARLTLLNPSKRKEYNEQLAGGRNGETAQQAPPPQPSAAVVSAGAPPPQPSAAVVSAGAPPPSAIQAGMPLQPLEFDAPAASPPGAAPPSTLSVRGKSAALPVGLIIGGGVAVVVLVLFVVVIGGAVFFFSNREPQGKHGGPIAQKKADGNKAVADGGPMKKQNEDPKKIDELPPKDGAIKINNPPPPDPQENKPVGPLVTLLPTQGTPAAELIVELPKNRVTALLTSDGSILACQTTKNGYLAYRKAPDFDVENEVQVVAENSWIIPAATSPDGKKMALRRIRGQALFDVERVFVFDWTTLKIEATVETAGRPDRVIFSPDMKSMAATSMRFKDKQPEHYLQLYQVGPPAKLVKEWRLKEYVGWFGFTPDGSQFVYADQHELTSHTWSMKTGEVGEAKYHHQRMRFKLSPDFSLLTLQQGTQLQVSETEPFRPLRTLRGMNAETRLDSDASAFSPDNRYLLAGTMEKLQGEPGQVSLIELRNGKVLSATEVLPGRIPAVQLAANGMAVVQYVHPDNSFRARLYRFPGLANMVVKNDPPAANAEDWVPLFNGKNLAGWRPGNKSTGAWSVKNGLLTGTSPRFGMLYTVRDDFKNFHLRAEARFSGSGFAGGADGLWARATLDELGYHTLINSSEKKTGQLYIRTKGLAAPIGGSVSVPEDTWFTLEIIADGNRTLVKVDGVPTVNHTEAQPSFTSGHIALSQAGTSTIEFRKIEIREFADAVAAEPMPKEIKKENSKEVGKSVKTAIGNRTSGKAIGVEASQRKNGSRVVQWQYQPMDDNHHWKLVPLDNGCFYIVNHFSSTYLSVENDGTKDGARIVIWEKKDGGEPAQQWKLVAADKKDGRFVRIINRASGLAMGVVGDSLQNGTPICLQPMNAATTVWRIDVPVASLKTAK